MTTTRLASYRPYLQAYVLITSPASFARAGGVWAEQAKAPAGTGPLRVTRFTPRQSVELARWDGCWDAAGKAKLDRVVLLPMPEANTRLATLRSGQVDRIEVPPPDTILGLRQAGFTITTGSYPHVWPWVFNTVREAGFNARRPLRASIAISTSGSGQMVPLPMNGFLRQSLKQHCGAEITFEVMEWNVLLGRLRANPNTAREWANVAASNNSLVSSDISQMARWFLTSNFTPAGSNMGHWGDAELDRLPTGIENERDQATINAAIAKAHERLVDNPPWLWMVHGLNPRAMTRRVRNLVSAQSWFIDLARIDLAR